VVGWPIWVGTKATVHGPVLAAAGAPAAGAAVAAAGAAAGAFPPPPQLVRTSAVTSTPRTTMNNFERDMIFLLKK
jgi:hypothetical protein